MITLYVYQELDHPTSNTQHCMCSGLEEVKVARVHTYSRHKQLRKYESREWLCTSSSAIQHAAYASPT